jgi:tripartite-type tricarboxylate transporter receptor subunit TctC
MTTRRALLKALGAATLAGLSTRSRAGDWPQRPVKIIVPFAAGGNTDGIARLIAQRLGDGLGQAFIVENRTGGGGTVAAETTARATPDGYTLMMAALPQIAVLPAMRKTDYDPVLSFAPISNVASNPFCLVSNPRFEPKTLTEFVGYVKQQPGKIAYASGGTGSISHLTMVLLCERAGLDMVHVPYRGGGPAIADVIGNQTPVYFGNLSEALPHAGQDLLALAVSGSTRAPSLPEVPTVAESGYPGFRSETWNGLIAPAKTPAAIIDLIAREVKTAVNDPTVIQQLDSYGVQPVGSSPDAFAKTISDDIQQWQVLISAAGLKL